MSEISFAIQAHPRRRDLAEALAADVGAEIVYDPDPDNYPSPWRTYVETLRRSPPEAAYRVVLQDDVSPCLHFREVAERAIRARWGNLITFFVGGRPFEHATAVAQACDAGVPWAVLRHDRWCPAVALAWPVEFIEPLLSYVEAQNWPPAFRADDEIIGRWLRASDRYAYATAPSLVEHEDIVPSLLGDRRNWAGEDEGRVAYCLSCSDCDPRDIDWSIGPL